MAIPDSTNSIAQPPFKLDDRQGLIYERLSRLVGPGAAEFYKDACRHMAVKPPFEATTHIVSHLLREIESALRDVLEALTGPIANQKNSNSEENHKNEILVILKALEIPESDPISKAWLELPGENGLQKLTHRQDLSASRPVDKNFLDFWAQMEAILNAVLDKFEAQYTKIFGTLDSLALKSQPTKEDAKLFHLHIPNNRIAHTHFFDQLTSPSWLPLLKEQGIFKEGPEPEHDVEKGTISYPPWPASAYLLKMASGEPVLVTQILDEIQPTENANVKSVLLAIATNLPIQNRISLMDKIKEWAKARHQFFVSEAASKLITKFIEEKQIEPAFTLAEVCLEILPDPKSETPPPEASTYVPMYNPITRLDEWQYGEFLRKDFTKLVELDPEKALGVLCRLLLEFLRLTFLHHKEDPKYEDLLHISRPAIEDHQQNHNHEGAEHALITTIRETASQLVNKNPALLKKIIIELENNKWDVFRRLALHLLSENPTVDPELVAEYLTNKELFESSHLKHEYALLAEKGFNTLNPDQQNIIFGWIDAAEEMSERIAQSKDKIPDENAEWMKERWRRDKLSYIKNYLTGTRKQNYENYVERHGEPDHPDFSSYSSSYVGPNSEVSAQTLLTLDTEALVSLLKTWKPKDEGFKFDNSKEGLGRELDAAIKLKPEQFRNIAEKFKGLDPTYIRAYLQAFESVIDAVSLDWEQILSLCQWVVNQPREIAGRKAEFMDEDPHWGWARKAVASFISRGANRNLIPFELRGQAWQVLEPLTNDTNPTPAEELDREGSLIDDAYTLSINTTRGEAMNAVIEYALWAYRNLEKEKGKGKISFGDMPEVRTVLELHLKPDLDPSIAVRAVYGRFFPWLLLMDHDWTVENLKGILPAGQFDNALYNAAWNSYVMYVPPYDEPFKILRDRYKEAVLNLGKVDKKRRRFTDKDERLIEHIFILYWRGKIELSDDLLVSFWNSANPELRGYALNFVGRSLQSDKEPNPPDILERLKKLWESRVAAAENSSDKTIFNEEMAAFGWWFSSAKFDEGWSAQQYLKALKMSSKIRSDHFVAERLKELVKTFPEETIKILSPLALSDEPGWMVFGNREEIASILTTALKSGNSVAVKEATELINRLVSKGYKDFTDLLK